MSRLDDLLLLLAGVLILLGYMGPFRTIAWPNPAGLWGGAIFFLMAIGFVIAVSAALMHLIWPRLLRCTGLLAIIIVLLGATMAFGAFNLSGPSGGVILFYGVSLSLGVAASLLIARGRVGERRILHWALLCQAILGAIWSLGSGWIVVAGSAAIANGRPYCVTEHQYSGTTQGLGTKAQERGFFFLTDRTGFKSTSTWYFHGLLIVDAGESPEVYNWSPRRMRFTRLERPEVQFLDPSDDCEPRADFWRDVPLL